MDHGHAEGLNESGPGNEPTTPVQQTSSQTSSQTDSLNDQLENVEPLMPMQHTKNRKRCYPDSINVTIPTFTIPPSPQSVNLTQTATFTCSATGDDVKYQWTIGSRSFPGKVTGINTNTLVIPDVRSSDDNTYSCTISNDGGSVTSHSAKLTVTGLPKLIVLPSSQSVETMQSAKFNTAVNGIGVENFTYQWQHNGEKMNGETGNTLNLNHISEKEGGSYQCIVKNQYGDSDISSAKLVVTDDPSKLIRFNQTSKSHVISDPTKAVSEFASVVSRIEQILKTDEVNNLNAIKSVCIFLPISTNSNALMFSEQQLKEIQACDSLRDTFIKLRFHLRWDDHLLLNTILDRLDSKACEELLGKYQSRINCQMRLEEIFNEFKKQHREVPKGFSEMVAIVNKKYSRITIEEYNKLKNFIAEHCGVECYVLSPFLNMSQSSLLLKWSIPSTAIAHMVEMATKNKSVFIEQSFTFLQIADTVIFGQDTVESDQLDDKATISMLKNQLETITSSLKPEDLEATLSTLKKIFDNIIQHPNDDKYRQIKLDNKAFSSKVWRYPACKELMKLSGWVVEDDLVKLRHYSSLHIASCILNSFCEQLKSISLPSGIVKIAYDKYEAILTAMYDGDIGHIQALLNHNNISSSGTIVLQNGQSINLLKGAIAIQRIDVVELFIKTYSVDFYVTNVEIVISIFTIVPQSFAINLLKSAGIRQLFKFESMNGATLLLLATVYNCFDIVRFLITSCRDIDVNTTDDFLRTPLHYANIAKHREIADYLSLHGADVRVKDIENCTPLDYIDGNPIIVATSQYVQNKRKINERPFSAVRMFYLVMVNSGLEDEEAVSRTMEKFPMLKEEGSPQVHYDVDHASVLSEVSKYISETPKNFHQTSFITAAV